MKASSDKMYDKFKDYDFSDAKRVAETPIWQNFKKKPVASLALP